MRLEAKDLSFSYGRMKVLEDISFSAESGSFTALLGRNGSGKTTLIRLLLGFLSPESGSVEIDGRDIARMSTKERAMAIAYIPQQTESVYSYTVLDAVMMGLSPSLSVFKRPGRKEKDKAMEALSTLGIESLAGRYVNRISGGERQLVLIARSIAQDARILLLDEPTSSLDYSNQMLVLETAGKLRGNGYMIILSTHNPEHALSHASSIIALSGTRLAYCGAPEGLLDGKVLSDLYGRPLEIRSIEAGGKGRLVCIPV